MRTAFRVASSMVAVVSLVASAAARMPQSGGIIEGRVTGPNGRPVESVRVALLTDTYSPLQSLYTDASGHFRFRVSAGAFYIEVDPLALPYERQQQRVDVNPSPYSHGGDIFHVDISLTPLKPRDAASPGAGVRFYQKVPDDARAEFERGTKLLAKDPEGAYAAMQRALELFPDYYACMETLGSEYVKADRLDAALAMLTHAIEVNPAGEMSHYALGVLYYKRALFADAVRSFDRASSINPKSANAALYLGLALVRDNRKSDAEAALKRAYELGAKGVADLHLALASIYIDAKRNHDAANELRLLLKEVPNLRDRDKIKALIEKLDKG